MKILFLTFGAAVLALTPSCKRTAPAFVVSHMGDPVALGSITYNVFEADWKSELEGSMGRRSPKNRFLLLKMVVTNGGGQDISVPLLQLENAKGDTYMEEKSGDGVPDWLGLLRVVKPVETAEGRILFDVPPGAYKLQVVDDGDLENQQARYIDIPYKLDEPVRVPVPEHPVSMPTR